MRLTRDETHLPQFKMLQKGLNVLVTSLTHKRFRWDMVRTINQCHTVKDLQLCKSAVNSVLAWEASLC